MGKQLISFAQVIKFSQNIKLKGGFDPKLPLRTPLLHKNTIPKKCKRSACFHGEFSLW